MTDILNADPAAPAAPAPVAPATPVVPATPATPVTPEPVVAPAAPVEKVEPAAPAVTFDPTGDSGLDLALEFFGKLGLSLDDPEMKEAQKGNFSYLEAKIASLGEKAAGGDRYIALAKDAHARNTESEKAAYEGRKQLAYDAVGGEETWGKIQEFVTANAEPQELEVVRSAMLQGGVVAKAVAEHLHRTYLASTGATADPASPTRHQATTPQGGAPLTLAGYRQELNVLVAKIGSNRLDGSPEYAALRAKYVNVK